MSTPILFSLILFAQEAAPPMEEPGSGGFMSMMPAMAIIMLLFYFMIIRPQKRKDDDAKSLVDNLKENDRVVTVGGIHGVVTNVQRDADRVTLRVDEATGTKLRVGMSAIARVVTEEKSDGSNKSENSTKKS